MAAEPIILGIDLGTTFSCVAFWDSAANCVRVIPNRFGEPTTPSAIWSDGQAVLVGKEAVQKHATGLPPIQFIKATVGNADIQRQLAGEAYTAEELSAVIIYKLVRDANDWLEENGYTPSTQAIITVPAHFQNPEREATRRAGMLAGLAVEGIINEPTAAAIAHGVGHNEQNPFIVFDLGGGTFDITIMQQTPTGELEVIVSDGNRELGGKQWDKRLQEYLMAHLQEEHQIEVPIQKSAALLEEARQAKIRLTTSDNTIVKYRHSTGEIKIPITREKFENITRPLRSTLKAICEIAIDDAIKKPQGLYGRSAIRKIVLAGGASRMPAIKSMMQKLYEDAELVCNEEFYDLAIAKGAAIYGRQVAKIIDVAPKTLAIKVMRQDETESVREMILKNTSLPCEAEDVFLAPPDARIEVLQGNGVSLAGYQQIGFAALKNAREDKVKVLYRYNTNGIIEVTAQFTSDAKKVVVPLRREGSEEAEDQALMKGKAHASRLLNKVV